MVKIVKKGAARVSEINMTEQMQGAYMSPYSPAQFDYRPLFGEYNTKSIPYKVVRRYLNRNIEALKPLRILLTDVLSGCEVVGAPRMIQEVEEELIDYNFHNEIKSAYIDKKLMGDMYLEPVGMTRKKASLIIGRYINSTFTTKSFDFKDRLLQKTLDKAEARGAFRPKGLYWVRAETIRKLHDEHGTVTGYMQVLNGKVVHTWKPGELITDSEYKYDSEIYGFTVVRTMFEDILTLDVTKEYIRNIFQNNGTPDFVIQPKDRNINPADPQYKEMKKELSIRRLMKKRGHFLSSGNWEWVRLNTPKDMEFPALLDYISRQLITAWDIPLQRVEGTNPAQSRNDDSTLQGYYERIENEQQQLAKLLNIKYFSRYSPKGKGVSIVYRANYARNKVRVMTWMQMLYNIGGTSVGEIRDHVGLSKEMPADIGENPFHTNPDLLISGMGSQQNTPGIDNNADGDESPANDK